MMKQKICPLNVFHALLRLLESLLLLSTSCSHFIHHMSGGSMSMFTEFSQFPLINFTFLFLFSNTRRYSCRYTIENAFNLMPTPGVSSLSFIPPAAHVTIIHLHIVVCFQCQTNGQQHVTAII